MPVLILFRKHFIAVLGYIASVSKTNKNQGIQKKKRREMIKKGLFKCVNLHHIMGTDILLLFSIVLINFEFQMLYLEE